ncbi:MAG: VWA domain-containing protein [Rhizobiaceae bacterium]|nr:VWA domain-containing protein [Rhizobiaceae bacterium]
MDDDLDLEGLGHSPVPPPRRQAREAAVAAAMAAFDEKTSAAPQGTPKGRRLTLQASSLWRAIMHKKMYAAPAMAGLVALPVAGYLAFHLMQGQVPALPLGFDKDAKAPTELDALPEPMLKKLKAAEKPAAPKREEVMQDALARADADSETAPASMPAPPPAPAESVVAAQPAPALLGAGTSARSKVAGRSVAVAPSATAEGMVAPSDMPMPQEENRDRVEQFDTNPVKSTQENPVSTFSIDVDTASYSYVRRSLKEGVLPDPDTVRVEELVNYFPYDWKGPQEAAEPFNTTVTVMPTPWNGETKLMHVAIKGFDLPQASLPRANLVFLIDVSGSMDEPDKLPLLRSAFRLLVNTLGPDDTVSIVTYAGDAGTVLEPTKASDKGKILAAIDSLTPGGSTAGEAGIREAYRLAQNSFVKDGINRVMLATDGDFNVGQTDDDDLKRLIEEKRKTGVFLSVFGFGRGNLNDQMMQEIAQNGNGTAAYIDTLAEAEKVLVEDSRSTLFPIAKDVKIQVEFNPATVAEYRLIGYETRALAREDFNNDKVDAGEIGSGHSVTAIYEITPKGSPAQMVDDLRYGEASTANGGVAHGDEYAFVKIRYKLPDEDVSKLITQPVGPANEVASFDGAGTDQRFSVAVAAFGQKLRRASQVADLDWDRISAIASAARGTDPYGYRAEFLSLVRLASALDGPR